MEKKIITGKVIFSGEIEEPLSANGLPNVDKTTSIKLKIKPPKGKSIEIICENNSFLEKGDKVKIEYSPTSGGVNYGNHYHKLDPQNPSETLREGFLRYL